MKVLINPILERDTLRAVGDSRMLEDGLGILGISFKDPYNPARIWTVQGLYLPIDGMAIGGVRAKVNDQFGYFSFVNQRDLEVLIEEAEPGNYCRWMGSDYVGPQDRRWIGLGVDEVDLEDDLYERELILRRDSATGILDPNTEIHRRYHSGGDYLDTCILMWDVDVDTGESPDTKFHTLMRRWRRIGRERLRWP